METNNWSERHCAVSLDATIRWPNASGFEHRQYSFGRGENRFRELERLLHEQIRARGILAIGSRRIARAPDTSDQYLSGGDEYRNLGRRSRRLATRENDLTRASGGRSSIRYQSAERRSG